MISSIDNMQLQKSGHRKKFIIPQLEEQKYPATHIRNITDATEPQSKFSHKNQGFASRSLQASPTNFGKLSIYFQIVNCTLKQSLHLLIGKRIRRVEKRKQKVFTNVRCSKSLIQLKYLKKASKQLRNIKTIDEQQTLFGRLKNIKSQYDTKSNSSKYSESSESFQKDTEEPRVTRIPSQNCCTLEFINRQISFMKKNKGEFLSRSFKQIRICINHDLDQNDSLSYISKNKKKHRPTESFSVKKFDDLLQDNTREYQQLRLRDVFKSVPSSPSNKLRSSFGTRFKTRKVKLNYNQFILRE